MGGRYIAHHRSMPALKLYKIVIQQHQNIVRMQEIALVVDHANTVRISVCSDTDVTLFFHHIILQ